MSGGSSRQRALTELRRIQPWIETEFQVGNPGGSSSLAFGANGLRKGWRVTSRRDQGRAGLRHRSLIRQGLAASVAATALSTCVVAAQVQPAAADPDPQNVAQAKAQVEKLQHEAEAADQQYLALKDKISKSKQEAKSQKKDLESQTEKVDKMREQVSQVALRQFQSRSMDTRTRLFLTRDTTGFLNQVATVEKINENQTTVLQEYQVQQSNLAEMKRANDAYVTTLTEDRKELKKLREKADAKVDEAEDLLDELTEEQRRAIEAEQEKQAAEAAAAAEADSGADDSTSTNLRSTDDSDDSTDDSTADSGSGSGSEDSGDSDSSDDGATAPSSGKGAQVVAFAKNQLGKPYSFGSTGPGSFDCSGLTSAAWASAGVQLSRTSQSQFSDGTAVSRDQLQPGDLVFFYSQSPSHVGIYVGNGTMIHAPRPGRVVEYSKISYMPFSGARRPG